ncbi:MAG TPA: trypco2 family protein [Actinomycetota bacterium]|nr:trypco2 family protein [Actinomycetota bacterium]
MPDAAPIGLAEAIRTLRAELAASQDEGSDNSVRFNVGPVELEFQVELSREAGVEGGVQFWVVSIGGKGSVASTTSHRLKLSLEPVDTATGKQLKVSDAVETRPD